MIFQGQPCWACSPSSCHCVGVLFPVCREHSHPAGTQTLKERKSSLLTKGLGSILAFVSDSVQEGRVTQGTRKLGGKRRAVSCLPKTYSGGGLWEKEPVCHCGRVTASDAACDHDSFPQSRFGRIIGGI